MMTDQEILQKIEEKCYIYSNKKAGIKGHNECDECHEKTLCIFGSSDTEICISCHNCGNADMWYN